MDVGAAASYPDDIHKHFVEEGSLRAIVPDDCGALGLGFLGRTVLIEEVGRVSAAVSMIPQVNELGLYAARHRRHARTAT